MLDNILDKKSFSKLVEQLVLKERLSYMEAILHICKEREIDPRDIGKLITPPLKGKVESEAIDLNWLPKKNNMDKFL